MLNIYAILFLEFEKLALCYNSSIWRMADWMFLLSNWSLVASDHLNVIDTKILCTRPHTNVFSIIEEKNYLLVKAKSHSQRKLKEQRQGERWNINEMYHNHFDHSWVLIFFSFFFSILSHSNRNKNATGGTWAHLVDVIDTSLPKCNIICYCIILAYCHIVKWV